jgi:hypothetical protein
MSYCGALNFGIVADRNSRRRCVVVGGGAAGSAGGTRSFAA